ncbi:hypothetical protein Plano_2321 [Planococcus sp. PAMC 21323]|nr:hypothetical protein Plano_2321 [Planococcus sp. PAMC 21323]
MINSLDKKKFNIFVLYIKEGLLKQELNQEEVKIKKIGDVLKIKSFFNILYFFKICSYVKENKINIIHTQDPILYYIGSIAAKITNIKHIRSQPNFISKYERKNAKTLKYLPFEKWTNHFITFNKATKKDLVEVGVKTEKITTIYGYYDLDFGISKEKIKRIKKGLGIDEEKRVICSIGRLAENKGLELYIQMIPIILEKIDNAVFLIIGDGPLKKVLIEMAKKNHVLDKVIFSGNRTDVDDLMKIIDLGVYANEKSAGMGIVPRNGKVLISVNSEIMSEYIVNGKTGFLINEKSPQAFGKEVIRILENEKLMNIMEANTKEFAINRFDGSNNIKIFENVVMKILNESK